MNLERAAAKWLAEQNESALRIAREITGRREALRQLTPREDNETTRILENGYICGLRLALSYLSDRPGDISQTGAEGFIGHVAHADVLAAARTETVLTARHVGKDIDPRRNTPASETARTENDR